MVVYQSLHVHIHMLQQGRERCIVAWTWMRHVSDLCVMVGASNSNALIVSSDVHDHVNGERSTREHYWHSLWEILGISYSAWSQAVLSTVQCMHVWGYGCASHICCVRWCEYQLVCITLWKHVGIVMFQCWRVVVYSVHGLCATHTPVLPKS